MCNSDDRRAKSMGFFERYLSLWVIICIGIGIFLGRVAPSFAQTLDGFAIYVNKAPVISIPIAICLFLMMYPLRHCPLYCHGTGVGISCPGKRWPYPCNGGDQLSYHAGPLWCSRRISLRCRKTPGPMVGTGTLDFGLCGPSPYSRIFFAQMDYSKKRNPVVQREVPARVNTCYDHRIAYHPYPFVLI